MRAIGEGAAWGRVEEGMGGPVAAAGWRGGALGTRPVQHPGAAGAGVSSAALPCKAEAGEARTGTWW
jgi:hypothetical protein